MRRFNRFYTRQIGLLDEGLLNSPFSLTQVRTLYELAQREQTTAAELCTSLGLDAGYLSRMLSAFEKSGLLEKRNSPTDARQTLLRLTKKGRKAFEPLNARSNDQVAAMLGKLAAGEAKRSPSSHEHNRISSISRRRPPEVLPSAAAPPRRHGMGRLPPRRPLLRRSMVTTSASKPWSPKSSPKFIENFDPARERCWIAEVDGENVGSVFLVKKSTTVAKLRLLLVEPSARGLGIGKRLVEECVRFARDAGYKKIMLWTQSELPAARHLYQNAGFKLVAQEKHKSWSRTDLVSETWELKL